jgi:hypothetical protein
MFEHLHYHFFLLLCFPQGLLGISPPMLSPGSETFGASSITTILRRYVVGIMFKIGSLISVRGFSLTDPPPFLLLVFAFRSPKTLKAYFLQDE